MTILVISGTGYSKMLWADISNAYKAVLHLKYHQFYGFTLSQQRKVFNKNNNDRNPCLSYITHSSIGCNSSAICQCMN